MFTVRSEELLLHCFLHFRQLVLLKCIQTQKTETVWDDIWVWKAVWHSEISNLIFRDNNCALSPLAQGTWNDMLMRVLFVTDGKEKKSIY